MPQIRRDDKKRTVRRTINAANAAEAVGAITPGIEIYGVSKGQFSLVELVEHILDTTGPAALTVSTWTAAGADLAHTATLLADGRVQSCRWLVDFSFASRQPAYCADLVARFGFDSIRCTANHAKFVLVRNGTWNVAVRTSMNLNLNRRLESYEISDDFQLADWLEHIVNEAFRDGATIDARPVDGQNSINHLAGSVARRPANISSAVPASISFGDRPNPRISHD